MIRFLGATLLAFCALYSFAVHARSLPPWATIEESLSNPNLRGSAVILSDGLMIGYVASAWSGGSRLVTLRIILDDRAGLAAGELTLTVPEPLDPSAPIRLMLSRRALGEILASDAP
jgi:hypothetical protein